MLPYISLLLLFIACRQPQDNKKLATIDFKYSSYLWHINHDSNQREFYLANYFHIDTNGQFKLIRHTTFLDNPQYFRGTLNDSIRQIIDSMLLENKYHPEIKTDGLPDTSLIVYDGFTYLLDYEIVGKGRTIIQYINSSSRSPKNILLLTSLLDTLISKTQLNKIDSFTIETYIDTLKKVSSYNLPPPPKRPPPDDKSLRFIPPKTKH